MRYAATLTIPANTTEDDPHEKTVDLCYGQIKQVFVLFPPGHGGLTHLQVFYQTRQIFPTTPGESFTGGDTTYEFDENWPIYEPPLAVTLRAWNLDDTYEHSIIVQLLLLPLEIMMPVVVMPPQLPEGM